MVPKHKRCRVKLVDDDRQTAALRMGSLGGAESAAEVRTVSKAAAPEAERSPRATPRASDGNTPRLCMDCSKPHPGTFGRGGKYCSLECSQGAEKLRRRAYKASKRSGAKVEV